MTAPLLNQIQKLVRHAAWANASIVSALEKQRVAPDVLELFGHVLGAEEVWLSRLEGRERTLAVWPQLTVPQLRSAAAANAANYRRYLDTLPPERLGSLIPYTNSAGQAFEDSIADILMHVAMHGAYHRGQVALRIRRDGGEPVATDFIAFVRGAPAATRRDSGSA